MQASTLTVRHGRSGIARAGRIASVALAAGVLSACGSLTGLGGGGSLTCKLPSGARCDSVSNTYGESLRGELPGQQRNNAASSTLPPAARSGTLAPAPSRGVDEGYITTAAVSPGSGVMPLRSQSKVMRIWIKAWEDSDGDLHDQSFVYIPVDQSRWMVDHKQRQVREAYAPARTIRPATPDMTAGTAAPVSTVPAAVSLNDMQQGNGQRAQGTRRGY